MFFFIRNKTGKVSFSACINQPAVRSCRVASENILSCIVTGGVFRQVDIVL